MLYELSFLFSIQFSDFKVNIERFLKIIPTYSALDKPYKSIYVYRLIVIDFHKECLKIRDNSLCFAVTGVPKCIICA